MIDIRPAKTGRKNRIRLMSFASRYNEFLARFAWFVLICAVPTAVIFGFVFLHLPPCPAGKIREMNVVPEWPEASSPSSNDWSIFQSSGGTLSINTGSLSKRFRLAGTFFAYGGKMSDSRKAILDDLSEGIQHVVSEHDEIDDVMVVSIFRDRVVLRDIAGEEELWLSFSRVGITEGDLSGSGREGIAEGSSIGPTARFGGKQLGEHRWMFRRQALLDYYAELMDEPERLVKVFDSLKPVRDQNRKITGYVLDVEGEADFFDAVGLSEGDIIRSVNSMRMTSQRRAEYFINEFIQDRANAFILDVQRGGQSKKLIYQVR